MKYKYRKLEDFQAYDHSMPNHGVMFPDTAYHVVDASVDIDLVVHKRVSSIWSSPSEWVVSERNSGKSLMIDLPFSEQRKKYSHRDSVVDTIVIMILRDTADVAISRVENRIAELKTIHGSEY